MMKPRDTLSLDSVLDEPVPFSFELSFTTAGLDREPLLEISPVLLEGEVSRIEKGFSLDARLTYGGRLECSRCLAGYPFDVREDFTLLLTKRTAPAGGEIALAGEQLDEYFYDEPVIPVAPIAEERIQMAVPMKPLCREECRGLCATCGEDLNVTECGCAAQAEDPRWEPLRLLKKV
jgi:uncharacterized protein